MSDIVYLGIPESYTGEYFVKANLEHYQQNHKDHLETLLAEERRLAYDEGYKKGKNCYSGEEERVITKMRDKADRDWNSC